MEIRGVGRRRGVAVLVGLAALAVSAALMTGSSAASQKKAAANNPFAHYGNITINLWSADNQDPGPQPVIKALAASFSKKYPNVTVKTKFYDFSSYIKIVKLSLNSANAPDAARAAIRRYAAHLGADTKYHETITLAWMRLVAAAALG